MTTTIGGSLITFGDNTQQTKKVPYFLSRTQIGSLPYAITGISTTSQPTSVAKIYVGITVTLSGTDTLRLNLGTGAGTYTGTSHWGMVGETAAASYGGTVFSGTTYIQLTRTGAASYTYTGNIEISRFNTNTYFVRWSLASTSGTYRTVHGTGYCFPGGSVDRIQFSVSGTNTVSTFAAWINPY